jgi:hypothetical protein
MQNIGMVVTRQWNKIEGNLCRRCIGAYFRSFTLTTLFLGWWGVISFCVTPLILLNNIARYLLALRLPEPSIAGMNTPLSFIGSTLSVGTNRRFKLIYGAIVCIGVLVYIAYQSVGFMEKHAPRVNAALHSGELSEDSDMHYAGMKIGDDIKALEAPYKSDGWAAVRSEILSREPYLNDLKLQNERFQQRIVVEKNANLGDNDVCERIALTEFGPALKNYARTLDAEFTLIKNTPEATKTAATSLHDLGKQEDDGVGQLSAYFDDVKTKGCK